MRNLPSFRDLKAKLDGASQGHSGNLRGQLKRIKGLDGRPLNIRSPHKSLNTLIQGAGSIVCKTWLVCIMKKVHAYGLDVRLVASIHDEYQFEVRKDHINRFCNITKESMKQAEQILKLQCPMDNDFKIGKTWAETH